jgi:tRNA threonylcarbamoyladenosine biosynthesis protein TsaB
MLLLAFDTTAPACSIALVRDGTEIAGARALMPQGQAEALVPLIERVMAEAGVSYASLDRIAVTVGPGSFTGVRVGLSTARALGLAAGKPVIGVSSLEVLAAAVADDERAAGVSILAAADTKRGEVYIQPYCATGHEPLGEAVALAPENIAAWLNENPALAGKAFLLVGDGAALVQRVLPQARASAASALPDAVVLARLAAQREPEAAGPLPLYVVPPRITLAPHGGRLRPAPESPQT